ncbi:3842_t:CDS:1, partial [Ambispora leptoticha]
QTIKQLPNNKSSGIDGLTYEFYKLTEEQIVPILEKIFNQVLTLGMLPISWCKNMIILIPKKSTDLNNLDNWRLISLVNCDAKIFIKILATRLNEVCNFIISDHQQEFITGRSIADEALDILTVMKNQTDTTKQH